MDIPTWTIILSFVALGICVAIMKIKRIPKNRALGITLVCSLIIWLYMSTCGEVLFHWTNSTVCLKYLGCGSGFFGYDAFQHLLSGMWFVLLLIWFCNRYPKYSILNSSWWKTAIIVITFAVFISVLWEMVECAHDVFRLDVLHDHLLNSRFHINELDQPSNLDTMGDLSFNLVGAIIGFFTYLGL